MYEGSHGSIVTISLNIINMALFIQICIFIINMRIFIFQVINIKRIHKLENCLYSESKTAFWKFHNALMQMPIADLDNQDNVYSVLDKIEEIDKEKIIFCSQTIQAEELLEKQISEIKKMNVEGTPTIFVNDQVFIGPKPLRVYEKQLSTDIDWFGYGLLGLGALILLTMIYFAVFKRE